MKKIRPSEEILYKYASTLEETGRVSSQTLKDIEKLYDIPTKYDDKEFKKNLVEVAHPKPAVLFNAYDKINGLVENVNERQNIISNILDKKTEDGERTKKYAQQLLTLSLIKIANDADLANIDDIRILADHCISQLTVNASKEAIFDQAKEYLGDAGEITQGATTGGIIGGLIGLFGGPGGVLFGATVGSVIGGGIASFTKTAPEVKNVYINARDSKEQLTDVLAQFPSNQILLKVNASLDQLLEISPKYYSVIGNLEGNAKTVDGIITAFEKSLFTFKQVYKSFLVALKSGAFEDTDSSSAWSKVVKPLYSFMDDDVDDTADSLASLNVAADKAIESIKLAKSSLADSAKEAIEHLNQREQELKSAPSSESAVKSKAVDDEETDNALENLAKKFELDT